MVAHDNHANKVTSPTKFKIVKGRPIPDEPHIGSIVDVGPKAATPAKPDVAGETTRPTKKG